MGRCANVESASAVSSMKRILHATNRQSSSEKSLAEIILQIKIHVLLF